MQQLLAGLAILVGGGILSLLCSRAARAANWIGGLSAAAGSVVAAVPAVRVLLSGKPTELFSRPWQLPFASFSIQFDPLSAWFAAIILGLSALAAIYGIEYMSHYAGRKSLGAAWLFYNLLVAAMTLVVAARDGMLFMLAWEGMALSSYFLVAFEDEKESVRDAGCVYLIASHLGVAFLLAFFVLLGSQAGTLSFAGIMQWSMKAGAVSAAPVSAMFLLAIVGFGTKAGFMPVHVWLPEAHPVAPSHVSALMSGVMIKTGIYGIMRTLAFLGVGSPWWAWLLVLVGVVSGILGIMFALAQRDMKRFLAYSSVENVGIIAIGLGIGMLGLNLNVPGAVALGFGGALLHVMNHAIFKGLLFLSTGAVLQATHTANMERLGGVLKRMPVVGAVFAVGCVAICGLPPLNGFVSEFLIYLAAFEEETFSTSAAALVPLATIGGLAAIGGLSAAGFTRLFGMVFLGAARSEEAEHAHSPGWLIQFPIIVLAAGTLAVVIFARPLFVLLAPAVDIISPQSGNVVREQITAALDPIGKVILVSVVLVGAIVVLAGLRKWLLLGRDVGASPTWDCGYAAPAATMQYTSSSYAQPIVEFHKGILKTEKRHQAVEGLFPRTASLATHTPDLFMQGFYSRLFQVMGWVAGKLAWIQHGRLSIYVLYVALALFALLVWYFGTGRLVPPGLDR